MTTIQSDPEVRLHRRVTGAGSNRQGDAQVRGRLIQPEAAGGVNHDILVAQS